MSRMGIDLTPGWNISDTVSGVERIVNQATKPIGDALGQFANSGIGQFIMQAATTGIFTVLAGPFGPQLASVAFALPGIAKGDDFAKAYTTELFRRIDLTGKIIGEDAIKQVTSQLSQYVDKLKDIVPPDIGDRVMAFLSSNTSGLGGIVDLQTQLVNIAKDNKQYVDALSKLIPGQTPATYAKLLTGPISGYAKLIPGGREDAAVMAKAALFKVIPPQDMNVDALTGKVSVMLASKLSELLGIPVQGTNSAFTFPEVGSEGYLLADQGGYNRGEAVTIQEILYKPGLTPIWQNAMFLTVGDGPNNISNTPRDPVQITPNQIADKPPPQFPDVGAFAYLIAPVSGFVEGERVIITEIGPSLPGIPSYAQNFYTSTSISYKSANSGTKKGNGPPGLFSPTPIPLFPAVGSSGYMMMPSGPFITGERVVITSPAQVLPGSTMPQMGVRGYSTTTKHAFVMAGSVSKSPITSGISKSLVLNADGTASNTSVSASNDSNVLKGVGIFGGGLVLYGISRMFGRK